MRTQAGIESLKGVGEKTALLFHKLGIYMVEDLLRHYPHGYETMRAPVMIEKLKAGETAAFRGTLCSAVSGRKAGRFSVFTCRVKDESGSVFLTFFNMPYIRNVLKPGVFYVFRGMIQKKGQGLSAEQPKVYKEEEYHKLLDAMQPKYPLTKGLTNNGVTKVIRQAFMLGALPEEYLPAEIRERKALCGMEEALFGVHFPENEGMLKKARKRLVFDEFFLFALALRKCKDYNQQIPNTWRMLETAETVRFQEKIPFQLTNAQKRVWAEIKGDLQGENAMNRLVQGDVGSGKTILAVLALLMAASNGYQGAFMAPTEVLARQHFESIQVFSKTYGLPFKPVLLTGSVSIKEKRDIYERLKTGMANLVIGTHALIQEKAVYKNLALVVTDEQHRFGVRQREALSGKGRDVHVLVMSATPIPRTLAIILYGDLQISLVDELPANRLPIKNCVVGQSFRPKAYAFIEKEVAAGRQAYVICPMVEEGDLEGVENVMDYAEKLQSALPSFIRVATLHGKMKPVEKNKIMEAFGDGNIDVLVSTTVIEVGINVPNATVMMVENAERFGLAQLHQLRGRVGRGKDQSYCIFITASEKKETMERLEILNRSNDGFFIAGEDLRLRGPGDLFGIRQSGILDFLIGDIYQDADVLKEAVEEADRLLLLDSALADEKYAALGRVLAEQEGMQVDFRSI